MEALLSEPPSDTESVLLFSFIGWRLWKTRNDLVFQNNKWSIPEVINKAILEQKLWWDANYANKEEVENIRNHLNGGTLQNAIQSFNSFDCFVDASWTSPEEKIGFGWILKNPQVGHC